MERQVRRSSLSVNGSQLILGNETGWDVVVPRTCRQPVRRVLGWAANGDIDRAWLGVWVCAARRHSKCTDLAGRNAESINVKLNSSHHLVGCLKNAKHPRWQTLHHGFCN